MARLNDTTVRGLRTAPGQDRIDVWFEEKGLGMRVSKTGRKAWTYVYHFQGLSRRMTFGLYPTIGVADVRAMHARAMQDLEAGIDPGNKLQAQRAETRSAPTVSDLANEYLVRHASHKRSGFEDERMLRKDVLPAWGSSRASQITRRDVTVLLDRIVERGAPIAANRLLALVRKMFNFGIERGILESNPCALVKQPARNIRRDRVLSREEIRIFWNGLDNANMSEQIKLALKLQLVTAQRKGEITHAEWAELDAETHTWTIPAAKAKNGQSHRVPLSPLALALLAQLRTHAPDSLYWLPSPIGEKPMVDTSIDHALRNNLQRIGLNDVTPHDLRRTAASYMTSLGIPRLTVAKILNHADSSVTAIYDRHGYDQEKRDALLLWAEQLAAIYQETPAPDTVHLPLADAA